MAVESHGADLTHAVFLLAAAVVAVPIFKRIGLGSVLGYLTAGLVIGPFGLGLFSDPQAILHVAELGVVLFLFIIGLEMEPSKLWSLRKEIFGLGMLQVGLCILLLSVVGIFLLGFSPVLAFIAGSGFVLTSTAIVVQILEERGEMASPHGQKIVSILLLEDLAIAPLLAVVAFLGPTGAEADLSSRLWGVGIAVASVAGLIAAGKWLLNPLFRLLASAHAREIMTAAALLVVLGSALALQIGGLSMAMGAFLAGVLLSESSFRHELEADIEPFRGILLGLFFLSVGMSLNLKVIGENWQLIAMSVLAYMLVKSFAIYCVARFLKSDHDEAVERSILMAQGGEFAFVLYAAASAVGLMNAETNAVMTATVIVSMAVTPMIIPIYRKLKPTREQSMDGIETADGLTGSVLIIGFGRFGQVVSQPLLLRGVDVSIIDNDVEMVQSAGTFGFKVYYGDGTRLDILHAAGAAKAQAVLICVDKAEVSRAIARHLKSEFPMVKVFARAYDRGSAIDLIQLDVDYQIRETFESALKFGEATLLKLGATEEEAVEIIEDVRRRDQERLDLQVVGGLKAGRNLMKGNMPTPAPLAPPKTAARPLNQETAVILSQTPAEEN